MSSLHTLLPHPPPAAVLPRRTTRSARFAHYRTTGEPPHVEEISADESELVDQLFVKVSECCAVPPIAVREVIENLAHADFAGACVSVLDGGATLRISDCGPGIVDKDRALQPGYSTATAGLLAVIRGVGSGLPVSIAAMAAVGGTLELDDNLAAGTVVTMRTLQAADGVGDELSDGARRLLAILVEIGPASPDMLAEELGVPLATCTRELVTLEHRGMVTHAGDGRREITDVGTTLLTTLF